MDIKETVVEKKEKTIYVQCDICHKKCNPLQHERFAWYWSDGPYGGDETGEIDVCRSCWDEIIAAIKNLGGEPRIHKSSY